MAKKNGNQKNGRDPVETRKKISDETRHGILAILMFLVSVFILLSAFDLAGVAGKTSLQYGTLLLGYSFYVIAAISAFIGISFIKVLRPNAPTVNAICGALMVLASSAIFTIISGESSGGYLGYYVSLPVVRLFDIYISIITFGGVLLGALLVVLDADLTFAHFRESLRLWRERRAAAKLAALEENDDSPELVEAPVAATVAASTTSQKGDKPLKVTDGKRDEDEIYIPKKKSDSAYIAPPLSLLEADRGKPGVGDIKANANIIKRTLANFGIDVEMDEISIGPSITRYAFKPAEGVKLARIVGLQNDLSLALAAHPLRIEAPIPGKSLVGIEIPNTTKAIVGMGSLIGSRDFQESQHPLYFVLGRGTSGSAYYANLAKSPHLLVAGTTGSGKSVGIHTIIASLLYRNSPEDLRFIMVDPKRVELTLYNGIPHLLTPVITDPKKAIMALKWATKEMERRYNILETESVRDIQSYHKNVRGGEPMPYIVIIIDELADMMTAYPRELEALIVRLAQMSRAVGIHLVLSTQRPSVEVITGLIKANIPSRVAFQVPSLIDSRTIIDMPGAEKLLGSGDMLYLGAEMSKPVRIQSAFISEGEVKKIVEHLLENYEESAQEIALSQPDASNTMFSANFDSSSGNNDADDELYEEAREIVMRAGKASTSYLQRRLKIGYARAARLMDILEEKGVVGPGEGAKPREVLQRIEDHTNDSVESNSNDPFQS